MQYKIPICFHESPARGPRQCERDLIYNSKRSGWNKFIFEHWKDRLMFELSDEPTAMAILGSARGSRDGFGGLAETTGLRLLQRWAISSRSRGRALLHAWTRELPPSLTEPADIIGGA